MSKENPFPMMEDKEFMKLMENVAKQDTFPFNMMGVSSPVNRRSQNQSDPMQQFAFNQDYLNSMNGVLDDQHERRQNENGLKKYNNDPFAYNMDNMLKLSKQINQFTTNLDPLIKNLNKMFKR